MALWYSLDLWTPKVDKWNSAGWLAETWSLVLLTEMEQWLDAWLAKLLILDDRLTEEWSWVSRATNNDFDWSVDGAWNKHPESSVDRICNNDLGLSFNRASDNYPVSSVDRE